MFSLIRPVFLSLFLLSFLFLASHFSLIHFSAALDFDGEYLILLSQYYPAAKSIASQWLGDSCFTTASIASETTE
jgi:hypothetical protein